GDGDAQVGQKRRVIQLVPAYLDDRRALHVVLLLPLWRNLLQRNQHNNDQKIVQLPSGAW
ncbi:MAG: hypothetical protein WCP31_08950, partial [Chloroflexales bacterium]